MKSEVYFDPEKHEYWLNNKQLISTTELLKKHGLSVDYSHVNETILEKAREFGKKQHDELEQYFKGVLSYESVNDITREGVDLLKANNIDAVFKEQVVNNDFVAGTIDLVGLQGDKYVIVDYKFTSQLHTNAVIWQTNIYRILLYEKYLIDVDKIYVLWYNKGKSEFELRDLPLLKNELIENLFKLERRGESYSKKHDEILYNVANQLELNKLLNDLKEAKDYYDSINNQVDIIKTALIDEMEKYGVRTFDLDNHRITYVQPVGNRTGHIRITEINHMSKSEVIDRIKEMNLRETFKKKAFWKHKKEKEE